VNASNAPTRRRLRTCAAVALCALSSLAQAGEGAAGGTPLLHPLFQDHVVLQRDRPIRVWGHAEPGQEVRVALAGKRARVRAGDDGRWQAQLPALEAGGPHVLSATAGGATQTAADVLVGDVWLCSGQSNMELQVWRALDARAELAGAGNDRIRLFTVPQVSDVVPRESFAQAVRWEPVAPDSLREFSAACYFFARELQKTVDVPMGLIDAAWGGSRIQAWTSGEALRALGGYDGELDVLARYADDPVDAVGDWGALWQGWWSSRPGMADDDTPWQPGGMPKGTWREAPERLGAWERWGVPDLADFNGMVWYRSEVLLTDAQAAQGATLVLGPADEIDMTWVNGRGVGSTYGAGDARSYALPAGLLRAGGNTIVVNVLDTYRDGGLAGPASAHALHFADGSVVPLDRGWRYRVVPPDAGTPPRAPWQSAAGLSTLYNGMIAPLGRFGLRGALWYQGESNTFEHDRYAQLLRALRSDWRARFGGDLPLLVVQLANFGAAPTQPGESDWAALREAQRQVAAEDPRSGLAVAIDIGDRYDIHPTNKQELGRRLARVARHVAYREALPASGPVATAARRDGDAVAVEFADVTGSLVAYGSDAPIGFELCGAGPGTCRYVRAELDGRRVRLHAADATGATRVRHAWADSPVVTLFDGAGLPAGPFELQIQPPQ